MRAMILAAGRGQRLSPLTDTRPKPLIRVGEKTLIEHQLIKLKTSGFTEVVINTGWLGQQLIEFLGNGRRYGVNIEYSIEPEVGLETGGGIKQALPLLGDDPFLVMNADIYHQVDLVDVKHAMLNNSHQLAHLVLVDNPSFNPEGDFCLEDGLLQLKKEALPSNRLQSRELKTLTFAGIGVYRPELFESSPTGSFRLAPLLKSASQARKITAEHTLKAWFDAGTQSRLDQITNFIQQTT